MSAKGSGSKISGRAAKERSTGCLAAAGLDLFIRRLREIGYEVIGPRLRDGCVVYDEVSSADDLPAGWIDRQDAATYRLERSGRPGFFQFVVGPTSLKDSLFPSRKRLLSAEKDASGAWAIHANEEPEMRYAFLGVRACELAAVAVQDRVFLDGPFRDVSYAANRTHALMVAVNCSRPADTCFCTSMGTGPQVTVGFDLVLTELLVDDRHEFLIEAGSAAGEEVLSGLELRAVSPEDRKAAEAVVRSAAEAIRRQLDAEEVRQQLPARLGSPRWDEIASRCLSCGNCTMVCPTCFCTTVEDVTDLAGRRAERWQTWDSCFSLDHSYLHGGSVRRSRRSRYRQWLVHKLATWVDQFGMSGCVGCGRCITWCPVGIDLVEEATAISRASATARRGERETKMRSTR